MVRDMPKLNSGIWEGKPDRTITLDYEKNPWIILYKSPTRFDIIFSIRQKRLKGEGNEDL